MLVTEIATLLFYIVSVPFLGDYFDLGYMTTVNYYAGLLVILLISIFPVWTAKAIYRRLHPPSYAKVQEFATP